MNRSVRVALMLSAFIFVPAANAAGTPVVWSCSYWSNAAKTGYYSLSRAEVRDPAIDYMTDSRARRLKWVAHLQTLGVDPGEGGSCDGLGDMKESDAKREASKSFYAANYSGRSMDTGWDPIR